MSNQNGKDSGLANQKINGHATYDLYNMGRQDRGFTDVYRNRSGRNN